MYPLCCPQPLCIYGNSFLLGQLLAINNGWNRLSLIIIVRIIRPFLSFVDQWELGFNLDCVPLFWNEVPWVRLTPFVDSYWVSWQYLAVLHLLLNSSQISFVVWHFWTIICMVFRTILILHSLTQSYVISCFFVSFLSNLVIQILCI